MTRVVTPGMVLDDQVLDPREASYLGAVALGRRRGGGLALLDASTGELRARRGARTTRGSSTSSRRAGVRELLLPAGGGRRPRRRRSSGRSGVPGGAARPTPTSSAPDERLRRHLGVASLDGFGVAGPAARARRRGRRARLPRRDAARRAAPRGPARRGSRTDDVAPPRRGDAHEPRARADALGRPAEGDAPRAARPDRHRARRPAPRRVAPLPAHRPRRRSAPGSTRSRSSPASSVAREDLAAALRPVADVERLLSRLVLGQGNARDLRALAGALLALPGARRPPRRARGAALLRDAAARLRGLEDARRAARRARSPRSRRRRSTEGGLIRRGHSRELDEIVAIAEDGKGVIAAARGEGAGADRDRLAQGPLQPGVRLLHRGHEAEPPPRARRTTSGGRRRWAASAS